MTRPIHCMYDIETIGGRDGAPIVQLGAVMFSPWGSTMDFGWPRLDGSEDVGVISSDSTAFRANVRLTDQDLQTADWSTIEWWLTRPSELARRRVFAEPERIPLRGVLAQFADWVQSWGRNPKYWWSDLDFDCRLMRQAYDSVHMGDRCPFGTNNGPHRGVRDYRTLRWIGKSLGIEAAPRVGVDHDALDDAYNQAYYAIKVLRHLGVEREAQS